MTIVAHGILFVLPLLAFVALARTVESPWRMSEAIIFKTSSISEAGGELTSRLAQTSSERPRSTEYLSCT